MLSHPAHPLVILQRCCPVRPSRVLNDLRAGSMPVSRAMQDAHQSWHLLQHAPADVPHLSAVLTFTSSGPSPMDASCASTSGGSCWLLCARRLKPLMVTGRSRSSPPVRKQGASLLLKEEGGRMMMLGKSLGVLLAAVVWHQLSALPAARQQQRGRASMTTLKHPTRSPTCLCAGS